jgi:hypothetical protein
VCIYRELAQEAAPGVYPSRRLGGREERKENGKNEEKAEAIDRRDYRSYSKDARHDWEITIHSWEGSVGGMVANGILYR